MHLAIMVRMEIFDGVIGENIWLTFYSSAGTSAFVTKTGKLIMFGKDTAHCDSSGFVTDLMDQHIVSVALGKAHCVALNSKGHLFTFGLNNKGQCGRLVGKDHFTNVAGSSTETSAAVGLANVDAPEGGSGVSTGIFKYDTSTICDFEEHHVDQGQCRVNINFITIFVQIVKICPCRFVHFAGNVLDTILHAFQHKILLSNNAFLERK